VTSYTTVLYNRTEHLNARPGNDVNDPTRTSAVASENSVHLTRSHNESEHDRRMIAIGLLFVRMLCDYFADGETKRLAGGGRAFGRRPRASV
jgi:hypothetical protein